MVGLNKDTEKIKTFLTSSITRFQAENEEPTSVGIYCCPWSGWMTTNFNITKKIEDTKNNCPDFDFVEFDFMELVAWENEYETDHPTFKLNGSIIIHNHNLGDENLNQLIFEYLKPILIALKNNHNTNFLLQLLDSTIAEML